MTEREAAMMDHSYACGMRQALAMAAQGADDTARKIADRLMSDALHVIVRTRPTAQTAGERS